MLKTGMRALSY